MGKYIDKQAFIKQTKDTYCRECIHRKNDKGKFVYEIGGTGCKACDIGDMMNAVDDYPDANVAPVINAHWIHLDGGLVKCSNCEWIFKDVYDQDNEDTFCRKCGAKMDESGGE